jgi:outer membrane receptor protein involved in Fe transport
VAAYEPPSSVWSVSLSGHYADGQYLRGDESNLNPKTGSFFALNVSASWRLGTHVEVLGEIQNLLDSRYETFGTFSPTSDVPILQVPNASNPRSLSPAAPLAAYAGIRAWL